MLNGGELKSVYLVHIRSSFSSTYGEERSLQLTIHDHTNADPLDPALLHMPYRFLLGEVEEEGQQSRWLSVSSFGMRSTFHSPIACLTGWSRDNLLGARNENQAA